MVLLTILITTFGFIVGVVLFELSSSSRPAITNSLRDAAYEAQRGILAAENNMRSSLEKPEYADFLKHQIVVANLESSRRSIDSFTAKIEELARVAAAKDESIVGSFITSQRLLFIAAALFLAVIVKLLIELYKYNAHLRSHYVAISDALHISGGKLNASELNPFTQLLSPPDIRIGPVRSLHDAVAGLVGKEGKSEG